MNSSTFGKHIPHYNYHQAGWWISDDVIGLFYSLRTCGHWVNHKFLGVLIFQFTHEAICLTNWMWLKLSYPTRWWSQTHMQICNRLEKKKKTRLTQSESSPKSQCFGTDRLPSNYRARITDTDILYLNCIFIEKKLIFIFISIRPPLLNPTKTDLAQP